MWPEPEPVPVQLPAVLSVNISLSFQLWDIRKKAAVQTFQNTYQVLAVTFNDTSDQIISGGIDNDIKVGQVSLPSWPCRIPPVASCLAQGRAGWFILQSREPCCVQPRGQRKVSDL